MNGYNFFDPTRVIFGPGSLNKLSEQQMPGKKAMVVISNGKSTRTTGTLDRTLEQLQQAGVETVVFDKVGPNPVKEVVEEGGRFAVKNGCDFIVALGGGSVMDAGKVMAMYANQPGDLWDYANGSTGKKQRPSEPVLPVIAITTTAGTGSEVDSWGVVTKPETNEKIGIGRYPGMFPVLAIVDPELMVTVPPLFTAYQGFDALFHSTEGYITNVTNFMGEMVQLTAIEKIGGFLERAVADGSDIEAREAVAFANTLSGYSMVLSSCASEHAMEHAMSAFHPELPHGAGLLMISIEYYKFFIEKHVCDERFVRMAKALGVHHAKEPMEFVDKLYEMQKNCGVADLKMSDYGITRDELPALADNAMSTLSGMFNVDRVKMTREECIGIYERSYK